MADMDVTEGDRQPTRRASAWEAIGRKFDTRATQLRSSRRLILEACRVLSARERHVLRSAATASPRQPDCRGRRTPCADLGCTLCLFRQLGQDEESSGLSAALRRGRSRSPAGQDAQSPWEQRVDALREEFGVEQNLAHECDDCTDIVLARIRPTDEVPPTLLDTADTSPTQPLWAGFAYDEEKDRSPRSLLRINGDLRLPRRQCLPAKLTHSHVLGRPWRSTP